MSPQPPPLTEYGTIDITGVPPGLVYVDLPRLGPTCKRLGFEAGRQKRLLTALAGLLAPAGWRMVRSNVFERNGTFQTGNGNE